MGSSHNRALYKCPITLLYLLTPKGQLAPIVDFYHNVLHRDHM